MDGHRYREQNIRITPEKGSDPRMFKISRRITPNVEIPPKKLIEAGFEYVCEVNGVKLFRKRKCLCFMPGMVRPPGFEPGLSARGADVLDQARRRPQITLINYFHKLI